MEYFALYWIYLLCNSNRSRIDEHIQEEIWVSKQNRVKNHGNILFRNDFPSVDEIAADSDLIFVMTDEFLEVQRPLMPNFVHIGSLGLEDEDDSGKLDEVVLDYFHPFIYSKFGQPG